MIIYGIGWIIVFCIGYIGAYLELNMDDDTSIRIMRMNLPLFWSIIVATIWPFALGLVLFTGVAFLSATILNAIIISIFQLDKGRD